MEQTRIPSAMEPLTSIILMWSIWNNSYLNCGCRWRIYCDDHSLLSFSIIVSLTIFHFFPLFFFHNALFVHFIFCYLIMVKPFRPVKVGPQLWPSSGQTLPWQHFGWGCPWQSSWTTSTHHSQRAVLLKTLVDSIQKLTMDATSLAHLPFNV